MLKLLNGCKNEKKRTELFRVKKMTFPPLVTGSHFFTGVSNLLSGAKNPSQLKGPSKFQLILLVSESDAKKISRKIFCLVLKSYAEVCVEYAYALCAECAVTPLNFITRKRELCSVYRREKQKTGVS